MNKISWEVPIKTISEANCGQNRWKKAKRHKAQQMLIRILFKQETTPIPLPCVITLTRLSPRMLDGEENLPMAFKWIKDEIGACLFPEKVVTYRTKIGRVAQNKGHADSDPRVTWKYAQERNKTLGIRIEIEAVSVA